MAGVSVFAVLLRLSFWAYTHRTWEDALITVQHAENAARGLGFTHVPGGPRIHGFTSPISVLIPLLGELAHPGFGLPLLRLVSAICGGITVWIAMRISQRLGLAFPMTLLIGGYLAIEHQQILFGMAGMETQVAVTVLLLSIYSLFDLKPIHVGISLGLCMLARPDFAFWVVIAIAIVAWRCWIRNDLRPLEAIGLAQLLIYGPWLAFTTWYYGSPLPNTVLAKSWGYANRWYAGMSPEQFLAMVGHRIRYTFSVLGPVYGGNGAGDGFLPIDPHGVICCIVLIFVVLGMLVAMRKKGLPGLAIAGFILVYSFYYLFLMISVFRWYTVPLAAVSILAAGIGFDSALKACVPARWSLVAGYSVAAAYLMSLAMVAPATFRGEKNVQAFVEDAGRKQIGLYLASVMAPKQTLGCEALGYFGYYSRHEVFDYPGLCNWQVVQFLHRHPTRRNPQEMLRYFHPDYLILRPFEYEIGLKKGGHWLLDDYEMIADFRVPDERRSQLLFPHQNIDLEYYVLRRKSIRPEGHSYVGPSDHEPRAGF